MRELLPRPVGRARGHHVYAPDDWRPVTAWTPNLVLYQWGAIVGPLLATAERERRISVMYIEYSNVANPDDAVPPPTFDRAEGIDYYNALAFDATKDYLRTPLTATTFDSTDPDLYPDGNLLTFFARTVGVAGTHGKPFADAVNSKVFGAALVAARDLADATQDLVLSRFYFAAGEQLVKLPTAQIGVEWELELQ